MAWGSCQTFGQAGSSLHSDQRKEEGKKICKKSMKLFIWNKCVNEREEESEGRGNRKLE